METTFERDTAVRAAGDGRFKAEIAEGWQVLRGPHGGYVAAIITRALEAAVDDPSRQARSLTIHFTAPPEMGPVEIECSVERAGRSLSTVTARMEQGGRLVALALAAFSAPWKAPFSYADGPPPAPAPEDAQPAPQLDGAPPFRRHLEFRPTFGGPIFGGAERALAGGWLRLIEPQAIDAPYVAFLADAWFPAPFTIATQPFVAPTVDLTVHFRSPLPPEGTSEGDPVLGKFISNHAEDGFFEEDGWLWTRAGGLIAQSRQLALAIIPPR